jgi:hypothetical protein
VTAVAARVLFLPWASGVFSLAAAALLTICVFVASTAVFDRSALREALLMLPRRKKSVTSSP